MKVWTWNIIFPADRPSAQEEVTTEVISLLTVTLCITLVIRYETFSPVGDVKGRPGRHQTLWGSSFEDHEYPADVIATEVGPSGSGGGSEVFSELFLAQRCEATGRSCRGERRASMAERPDRAGPSRTEPDLVLSVTAAFIIQIHAHVSAAADWHVKLFVPWNSSKKWKSWFLLVLFEFLFLKRVQTFLLTAASHRCPSSRDSFIKRLKAECV